MHPAELTRDVDKLFALPEVCIRLHEMLGQPDYTSTALGQVLSKDVDLTARLLRIVNSPFYGFPARIDTVERAVTIVGQKDLLSLVLATAAVGAFPRIPSGLLNMARFWRHSVYCGVVARLLAGRCNVLHAERLFVAGLLHDIGRLLICHRLPDLAREVLFIVTSTGRPSFEIERDTLDYDHAQIGMELIRAWGLPVGLQKAVGHHHAPAEARQFMLEASIVHLANLMTHTAEHKENANHYVRCVDPVAWNVTGLQEDVVTSVLDEATPLFGEAMELVLPRVYR